MSDLPGALTGRAVIGFEPMADEPDYRAYLSANALPEPAFVIPPSKDLEPAPLAEELAKKFSGLSVAVFLPGQQFDSAGTRHGRGHGWYDRFLAAAPPEWIRIGISAEAHFSNETLVRKEWDQPVDWLLLEKNGAFEAIETGAR